MSQELEVIRVSGTSHPWKPPCQWVVLHCYPCQILDPVAHPSHQLYDLALLHRQTCQKAFVESGRRL
uniref:Uncharacterized protein n=1 Tax=Tanacetum cinerariifolium TaxID=118510 RepID=A0A699X345_TANCI|nr:hypothetical protein [Tanacetum cinerariifolium]